MHQTIPAAPSPPGLPRGICPPFQSRGAGVGHLQILRCPGAGYWPPLGLFPSFLSKRMAKDHCKISNLKQNTLRRLTKFSLYLRKNKNPLSSVESCLLEDEFSLSKAPIDAVILLFRLEYKTSVICHNVNIQNVKIARRDRPLILASNRSETVENLLHIDTRLLGASICLCCTLESTHSHKELFLEQAFPRN